jgi:hypothetical protein
MADKPIIFLCHSLGGRVVKRALSYSQTRTGHKVSHEQNIFTCTYGILFFGTPHHGSSKAKRLAYIKKMAAITVTASKSDLVCALEHESETLQNITDYFVPLMKHYRIYFFWEQEKTDLLVGKDYIVSRESAAPVYDETERAGIAADHSGMVKFEEPSSQGFRMVVDALLRYCEEAPEEINHRRSHAAYALNHERQREASEILRNTHAEIRHRVFFPHASPRIESFAEPRMMYEIQTTPTSIMDDDVDLERDCN